MKAEIGATMPRTGALVLEVSDKQATGVRPRLRPYKGEHVILRIDDAAQEREMLRRISIRQQHLTRS